jgi:hypothetical protein
MDEYQSVGSGSFAAGSLRGRVRLHGAPVGGAVVFLEGLKSGRALPARETIDLVVAGSTYKSPVYLVHTSDSVRFVNHDATLHTARFSGTGALPATQPMPPGADAHLVEFSEAGVYRVVCDNHPGEETWLVVVDHPYAAVTAADGSYVLEGVPAGDVHVAAVVAHGLAARETKTPIFLRPGQRADLDLDLDAAREIVP